MSYGQSELVFIVDANENARLCWHLEMAAWCDVSLSVTRMEHPLASFHITMFGLLGH